MSKSLPSTEVYSRINHKELGGFATSKAEGC